MDDQEYIPAEEFVGGRRLPMYKGYTVDYRLKEFRKAGGDWGIEFVPFSSEAGDALLTEMIQKGFVPDKILSELV